LHSRITVTDMNGHPEQTGEMHEQEIATLVRLYGDRSPRLAIAVMNKGVSLGMMGRPDLASPVLRDAIAILESVGGRDNPQLDLFYANLGATLRATRRFDEARIALQRSVELQGDRPPGGTTVMLLLDLAIVELLSERPLAALEYVRRGMDAAGAVGGGGARDVPALTVIRGMARVQTGDAVGGAEDCRRTVSMFEAQGELDPSKTYSADVFRCVAEAELALGHVDTAIVQLERSVSFEHRSEPGDLGLARFALARALRTAGRTPERAAELARSARAEFAALPGFEKEVAAIDRWLAER
jgi:tetratricopeptide (TPR) repeat protein